MSKVLVITGSEYSGWDTVAHFLSETPNEQTLFDNPVVTFNKGLSVQVTRNTASISEAKKCLTQLISGESLGWADNLSINFLPFWASISQVCQFVLVYSSPECAFASAIKIYGDDLNHVNEAMANWEVSVRTMLDFFQKNRSRCLLVNVSAVNEQSDVLIAACSKLLGQNISNTAQSELNTNLKVIEAKAALLLPNYDELHGLYDELQSAASLPGIDINLMGAIGDRKTELATEGVKEFLKQQKELKALIEACTDFEIINSNYESKNEYLKESLATSKQDQELSLLQIHQLQEELETQNTELASCKLQFEENNNRTADLESKNAILETSNSNLKEALQSAEQDQELSLLQIHQLQEELETQYAELESCKSQFEENNSRTAGFESKNATLESSNSNLKEALQSAEQDQELSLLQIHQLQEELEHYYIKYEELRESALERGLVTAQYRSIEHATVSTCEIIGAFYDEGYEDISVSLKNLVLSDGRRFDNLPCKLVLKAGMVGLEFRPDDENNSGNLLNWPTDMHDQYGAYLLYLSCPNEDVYAQQQALIAEFSTVDRQLIYSVARVLAECFMTGSISDLTDMVPPQLKKWRLSALQLADQAEEQNQFLTFNAINLNEEFRIKGYEHLWLQCEGLQIGQQFFPEFNFKLAAVSNAEKSSDNFADQLLLEFRTLANSRPPFQSWPPEDVDEYGPKLLVMITVKGKKTKIGLPETITDQDKDFIVRLTQKLPAMLNQLENSGVALERKWPDWHKVIAKLATNSVVFSSEKRSVSQKIKGLLSKAG